MFTSKFYQNVTLTSQSQIDILLLIKMFINILEIVILLSIKVLINIIGIDILLLIKMLIYMLGFFV
jgi:hypothetical protein